MSPRKKQNTERINVFLAEETVRELKAEAERKGMTVSSLVRMVVLERLRGEANGK